MGVHLEAHSRASVLDFWDSGFAALHPRLHARKVGEGAKEIASCPKRLSRLRDSQADSADRSESSKTGNESFGSVYSTYTSASTGCSLLWPWTVWAVTCKL